MQRHLDSFWAASTAGGAHPAQSPEGLPALGAPGPLCSPWAAAAAPADGARGARTAPPPQGHPKTGLAQWKGISLSNQETISQKPKQKGKNNKRVKNPNTKRNEQRIYMTEQLRSPWIPALCWQPAGTFPTACAAHCLQGLNHGSGVFDTKMFSEHFSSRSVLRFNSPLPGTPHPAVWF